MRTIKRHSIAINAGKNTHIEALAKAYAKEKNYWLLQFQQQIHIPFIKNSRHLRNQAVKEKYSSRYGLQARMWKLALQDAADMMDRFWRSIFDKIKRDIYRSSLDATQKHYAFWLLKDYARFSEMLALNPLNFKELNLSSRKKVINFLQKKIKKYRKNYPKIKKARSILLDENCYSIFTHDNRQYIKMMTTIPRKRITIPLSGNTPIKGNIRLIVKGQMIEVHYTADLKAIKKSFTQSVLGIDLGYSEIMTDSDGKSYETDFGDILTTASDGLKVKMQRRNKLHALQKKYSESTSIEKQKKAKNILKNNLGQIKLEENQYKLKATLDRKINTAFNQLSEKNPDVVVSEGLSHQFSYHCGRNWNRRLSSWIRGVLQERLAFKALAKGFSHQVVNPAYSSQMCVPCGFVDHRNRKGDKFKCLHCGYVNHADWVAALNLRSRYFDREITRYTPYREVKRILLQRFHRRLETNASGTVNGRIPDTTLHVSTMRGQSESEWKTQSNKDVDV